MMIKIIDLSIKIQELSAVENESPVEPELPVLEDLSRNNAQQLFNLAWQCLIVVNDKNDLAELTREAEKYELDIPDFLDES